MKRLLLALLAAFPMGLIACAQKTQESAPPDVRFLERSEDDSECARADSEGPSFTQAKRSCYEGLAATGRYQDILDRIEPLGATPQQKFFLGTAHFGLSHRTGARSLQCFHAVRAKALLEEFLVLQQDLFRHRHTFGTTDDMKYVDVATKTLGALKRLTGCEESSHTLASIERYGRSYAIDRLQGLFYEPAQRDALSQGFKAQLDALNERMRDFVSTASRLETRYGLNLTEIDSGRQYLLAIQIRINEQFKAPIVRLKPSQVGGDDAFPGFDYDPALLEQMFKTLASETERFEGLLREGGEIAVIRQEILEAARAESMDGYAARKEKRVLEVQKLSEQLLLPTNFWTELLASERRGPSDLQAAIAKPGKDELFQQAQGVDALWAGGMKRFCTSNSRRWYCKKGGS